MNDAGRRILGGLAAFLRHGHAASVAALTRGERAVLHRLLEVRPALPAMRDQYQMLLASGVDDEKPFICGDCGKRHSSEDGVKKVRGSLVCVRDCGVIDAGRRHKRPVEGRVLAPSKRAAVPPELLLRDEPTDDAASSEQTCKERAAPIVVEAVLTSVDGGTSSSHVSLLPVTGEDRRALDATNLQLPAIGEHNAGCYPPPHLPQRKGEARGPGSAPYLWYMQMKGRAWDGETASYHLARNDYRKRRFGHDRVPPVRALLGSVPTAVTLADGASEHPPSPPPVLPPPTSSPSPPPAAAAPTVMLTPSLRPPPLALLPLAPPHPSQQQLKPLALVQPVPTVTRPAADCASAALPLRPTDAFGPTPRPPPALLASTSTLPVVPSAVPRLSLAAPPRAPMAPSLAVPPVSIQQPAPPQTAAGAPPRLSMPLAFRASAPLASPAVSTRPPANATTPKTGDAAKRIILIKNVDLQSDRDSGEIRARLMELRHGPWKNSNGQGSRARMIVADATGDLQITAFEGVDTLVARLRVNAAYRFPLAGAVIKLKDEKWNRTTGSAYEVKLSKLGVQHVREEDDDRGLPAHNFSFVSIAAIGQLAAGTHVHVLGVLVAASGVVTAPNKVKGTETSRRMLKIADASGKSIEVTVFANGVQHIDGEVGRVITIKGDTGTFRGVPTLTASLASVDFEPTLSEADELRELWAQTPPEVTPLLPRLTYKPIASLANEPSTEPVDLLGVIASVEAPVLYTAANGTQGRRVGMVLCDASEAAVPLALFAPADGALPAFAPGKLLSVAGASMETYLGELKCRTWLDRVTLEPPGPEATDLRGWWASRPASYVAPSVTMHPLVAIGSVPSLPADTYVRVVAVVLDAADVVTAPTSKGGEASRRMLTIADASGKSIELTIWAPRVQDIGGDAGCIIALKKARTRVFRGAPSLTAFLEDVDYAPTLSEAQVLYELWAQTPPEVTPLLPSLTYKPIASLAAVTNEPSSDPIDLLAVIVSADPPVLYTAEGSGKQGRRVGMLVCDRDAAVPLTIFLRAEGPLPGFQPGMLLSVSGARLETFQGEPRVRTFLDRVTLEPSDAAAVALRDWWQARAGDAPPPTISSVWGCKSLADLPRAYETGEQTFTALGIVTGDAAIVSLDSGEVADVMTLCDQSGSVRLHVVRDGEQASHQYYDGMSLAIVAAKPSVADDGHLKLVAPEANLRPFPKAERAKALHEWYGTRAAGMRDEPAPTDPFGDQFGWESAFGLDER